MHPTLCNRLRAELSRVSVAIAEERAAADPDRRRIQELNMRRAWLSDALWSAEMAAVRQAPTSLPARRWIDQAEREM
ncbi:MAG TPA: hypothetical protein PLV04_05365 [Phenylobacterium sp.]|nr:hypothetical protein [Phenylobacterium sp.]HQN51809.1 hypothetical protein [Phenylobacterium sp.]